MKKILIALDNEELVEKFKKTGKYWVYDNTITFQEGVIEYLANNKTDVVITKDSISGSMTKEIYIKQLRLVAPDIKIIVFTEALDETYKGFLFANNVFNVIEAESVDFVEALDMIEQNSPQVIYKRQAVTQVVDNSMVKVITKKLVAVFGTSGAGKSYVSSLISNAISKKLKLNTLLVDFDLLNSAIDIFNNINAYDNSLIRVMEDIDNDTFDSTTLGDNVSKAKKNSKLSYLINNASIYDAQNRLSIDYYSKIYEEALAKYDVTIVDLPTTPFLDVVPYTLTKADEIIFVVNPNFISIRQALKHLELMVEVWGIAREKIHIVVNKKRDSALDKAQVEMLLREYRVCMEIEDSDSVEEIVNGVKEIDYSNVSSLEYILSLIGNSEVDIKKERMGNKINRLLGVKK